MLNQYLNLNLYLKKANVTIILSFNLIEIMLCHQISQNYLFNIDF